MLNFLLSSSSSCTNCYEWPVIKQIIWLFSEFMGILYNGLDAIGIANVGLVIILFTIVIRGIMMPFNIRQQRSTKITNIMQPEISAIQAKYQGARDQYSMQAMQAETKAVYKKYGISQTGGCVQSLIQYPFLIAMYGALRNIPTAITKVGDALRPIAEIISGASSEIQESISEISTSLISTDTDTVIDALFSLTAKNWDALTDLFSGTDAAAIASYHDEMVSLMSFMGFDLSQTPWNLMRGGGIGIIAVIIPLIAGAAQWLTFKLSQTSASERSNDQMAATTRSMGLMMPLFTVFLCFTLNAGLGLYWGISSLLQVIVQILINRHYRKIDMKEYVKQNMEKAAEKEKKKRERKGVSGETISSAANISTKNIEAGGQPAQQRPRSISEIANMNVNDTSSKSTKPPAGSLAEKAGMVKDYNENHPEEATAKRKYKK